MPEPADRSADRSTRRSPQARAGAGARAGRTVGAVLWTHGAGSDRNHHTLVALDAALAPLPARRIDFPYRAAGRRFPDRAPVLVAAVSAAAAELAAATGVDPATIVLGGRSMGGRMCSMAVADGLPAAGLVLISYPLHPPGKPEQLRTAHFPAVTVPCLFVSGTRDSFATPDELVAATATITGPVTHHWIERGRHELDRCDDELVRVVGDWIQALTVPASSGAASSGAASGDPG